MRDNIINFVLFQIGWFACVLGGAGQQPLLGVLIASAIITYHLWRAQQPRYEINLMLIAMLIGVIWDSLLVRFGLLDYSAGMLLPNTAPYWIVVLWALFATTLNLSLRWLKGKIGLAVVLGAIAGPLAYYAGARLGAVEFVSINHAFLALATGWAIFTPLLVAISNKMDGYSLQVART